MTDLAGARILITGAASGMGRLLARRVAERGARVVAWDLDGAMAGLDVERADVCDVSDRAAVAELAREVGPVDVLVNNAGVVSGRPLLELADEQIERTFAVNALALFWTTRAFLPAMIERRRGHVVTIASAAGLVATPRLSDYAASKHAAVAFDEALRMELRRDAPWIRTTVVCPFYVSTGMFTGARSRFARLLPIVEPEAAVDRIVRAIERDERRIFIPPVVRLLPPLRVLPVGIFDRLMDALGVTSSMDNFVGRGERSGDGENPSG